MPAGCSANAFVNASTNAQGIIVYGTNATTAITNLKIQNNQLYDCRLGYSEGIAVNGNVNGFEVTGNTVYNLTNIGIDLIGHEGACPNPTNDQARNGLVKNNIVHDCLSTYASSGGIYIDGGKIITVENNLFPAFLMVDYLISRSMKSIYISIYPEYVDNCLDDWVEDQPIMRTSLSLLECVGRPHKTPSSIRLHFHP